MGCLFGCWWENNSPDNMGKKDQGCAYVDESLPLQVRALLLVLQVRPRCCPARLSSYGPLAPVFSGLILGNATRVGVGRPRSLSSCFPSLTQGH